MTFVLEGPRVRLEPLAAGHAGALWDAASADRSTFGWTQVPSTRAMMDAYVAEALAMPGHPFAIVDKERRAVVGSTRFFDVQRWKWPLGVEDPRRGDAGAWDAAEIGYTWLARPAQRTFVNTEAKLLLLTCAFEERRARRVQLKTDARNDRSRTAILGLGARFEGILRSAAPAADGSVRDSAYYSILAAEWPGVKQALEERLRG